MKSIREVFKIGKGPSSSHTIGPERAARAFMKNYPDADHFQVKLYNSMCKTGKGHGTDVVLYQVLGRERTEVLFCEETPAEVTHPNTLDFIAVKDGAEIGFMRTESIGGGDIKMSGIPYTEAPEIYPENSFAEIAEFCRFRGMDLAEYVAFTEGEEIWDYLAEVWDVMKNAIQEGLSKEGELPGGIHVQRRAKYLYDGLNEHEVAQVRECRLIAAYAYAVSEQNADNGTIVTAPTCGACGVVPASLYYVQHQRNIDDRTLLKGLAVAGLFGNIIKKNASVSGAECGCQAEVGSACAMSAAAQAYLFGLSTNQIQYAAEIAIEHFLGLTCDPICGLVQVPCIQRNAVAAMRALNACNMAYFLSDTQRVSFDIIVRTMYETGISMNQRFRETAEGGLAKMFGKRR